MSFLVFTDAPDGSDRRTRRVGVFSARRGGMLGVIEWYGAWRQYVFEARPETVWSDGCLAELRAKVAALNAEQRAEQVARRREREEVRA